MLFTLLIVIQALVALGLITVILMQRSEGGGLVSGGSPSGMMSARGAADFLTRATSILATMFVVLSIALAAVAANRAGPRSIDPTLANQPIPGTQPASPIPGTSPIPGAGAIPGTTPAPAQPTGNSAVPIAQ